MKNIEELPLRIRINIDISTTGCWKWKLGKDKDGYGKIKWKRKHKRAHRVVFELCGGELKKGLVVDHLCKNPSCVNPLHLEMVTQRENTLRGIGPSANNAKKTHCKNGHKFTLENTYITKDGRRQCRKCLNERDKKFRSKNRIEHEMFRKGN